MTEDFLSDPNRCRLPEGQKKKLWILFCCPLTAGRAEDQEEETAFLLRLTARMTEQSPARLDEKEPLQGEQGHPQGPANQ